MARIDFHAIEEGIRDLLKGHASFPASATVVVEEEAEFPEGTVVGVYLMRRGAPDNIQSIAAGTRLREHVEVEIWVWTTWLDSRKKAAEARDDLLGTVETILMSNRTFGINGVNTSFITGGEFESPLRGQGSMVRLGASIELTVDVTATI